MSRIQSIEPNYRQKSQSTNVIPQMPRKSQNSMSFGGEVKVLTAAEDLAKKKLQDFEKSVIRTVVQKTNERTGWFGKLCNKLGRDDSEIQTQYINAVFTSTLAPAFIAFNPLSKQDKKTKEYTALRQPISAIIAISGGVAMTEVQNRYMAKLASEGHIKAFDLRLAPHKKDYLKHKFNKEYSKATDKKAFLESCNPEELDPGKEKFEGNKPTKVYKAACLEGYAKKINKNRQAIFTKLISESPDNIKIENGIININGKAIEEKIPSIHTQEELNDYLKENNLHNKKFSAFLKQEFDFEFYENDKFKPSSMSKKLEEVKAIDFLERLGLVEKDKLSAEALNKFLGEQYQDKNVIPKVKGYNTEEATEFIHAIGRDTTRNNHRVMGESIVNNKNLTLGQLFRQLNYKNDDGVITEKVQKLMDLDVKKVMEKFSTTKDHLLGLIIDKKDGKEIKIESKKTIDFATNIIKNKAAKASGEFKNFTKYSGIFFNLFTSAITCTVLNWAYPRVVAAVFPSLVKSDAKKGGNK